MTSDGILVVELILLAVAGVFVLLAGYFPLLSALRNERHDKTQAWFGARLVALRDSKWRGLPELVIRWFLGLGRRLYDSMEWLFVRPAVKDWYAFAGLGVLSTVGCGLLWGIPGAAVGGGSAVVAVCVFQYLWIGSLWDGWRRGIVDVYLGVWCLAVAYVWLRVAVELSVVASTALMLIAAPVYWVAVGFPLTALLGASRRRMSKWRWVSAYASGKWDKWQESVIMFAVGVAASFVITLLALLLGRFAHPGAWVPKTLQMLLANVVCDGFTMVATFAILKWAVAREQWWRIPVAVIADATAAAVLACLSLYFGLAFTEKHLTVPEVLNVLRILSPDGQSIDLGPYFWTMHTTFLPTIAYLAIILVCWLGKAALTPLAWFFGKGQENKNPLKLTALMCGFLALVFGLAAGATEKVRDMVKERESQVQPAKPNATPQTPPPPPAAPAPRPNGPTDNS